MSPQAKTYLIAVLAGIIGFSAGAGWQYVRVRDVSSELSITRRDLQFQRLEATLGAATIEAQRGSYELSRQLVSDFFTGLQGEIEAAPADRKETFSALLAGRDAMITALSRNDAQSGSQLAQMFVRYRLAMGEPVGPEPVAPVPVTTQ